MNTETEIEQQVQTIINDMIKECLEDPDALSCITETLEAIPEELAVCSPRLVLFTQDNCPVCTEDEEKYSSLIQQGKVTLVNANSPEGNGIMEKNNLDATPSLVLLDCRDNLIAEIFDSNVVEGQEVVDNQEATAT